MTDDRMGRAEMTGRGRLRIASSWFERMRGLLDRRLCCQGETLLLLPCSRIHTFGMGEAIDIAFVSPYGQILFALRGFPPNRHLSCEGAVGTLERRCNPEADWYKTGELIQMLALRQQ